MRAHDCFHSPIKAPLLPASSCGFARRQLHSRSRHCQIGDRTQLNGRRRGVCCRAGAEVDGPQTTFFSPSKINLFLRVVRKREDGYHELASLFHVIDLGDTMDFTPLASTAKQDELTCNMEGVPTDSSNLVIKALDLFRKHTGGRQHYRVHLEKRVPHGAGLGGGSGNAATAFWAANSLSAGGVSDQTLMEWGGEIGSDISIFFSYGAAYGTGRGELVKTVSLGDGPLSTPLLLVKPPVGLSTGAIFGGLDLQRTSKADPRQLLEKVLSKGFSPETSVNDLEAPAFAALPGLAELRQRLRAEGSGFSDVFMTGSGSTLVCVGSGSAPSFLSEECYSDTFVAPARLLTREPGLWYKSSMD